MEFEPAGITVEPIALPDGYTFHEAGDFEWQPRFAVMKRSVPEALARFEPVEAGQFKKPFLTRLLFPIIKRAEGLAVFRFYLMAENGDEIAYAIYDNRTRESGRNSITATLDPAHAHLAPFIIKYILGKVLAVDPDRVIEFNVPIWQAALADAAKEAGFVQRVELITMGLLLEE